MTLALLMQMTNVLLASLDPVQVEALRSTMPEDVDEMMEELGAFPPDTQPKYHIETKKEPS